MFWHWKATGFKIRKFMGIKNQEGHNNAAHWSCKTIKK